MRRPWVIAACPPVRERRRRCWYAAPFRRFARLVSIIGSISICMVLSRCVGRSWPSLYIDLANPATLSDPTHSLGMVNLCDDASLAISLPESTLVQSPPQMSACAHMHIHIRIGMRASSDARLAAAEAWAVTACGHGISTAAGHIVERLPHGELVQTRISKCGGARMT